MLSKNVKDTTYIRRPAAHRGPDVLLSSRIRAVFTVRAETPTDESSGWRTRCTSTQTSSVPCGRLYLTSGAAVFFFVCVCEARERVQIWIPLPAAASDTEDSLCVDVPVTPSHKHASTSHVQQDGRLPRRRDRRTLGVFTRHVVVFGDLGPKRGYPTPAWGCRTTGLLPAQHRRSSYIPASVQACQRVPSGR